MRKVYPTGVLSDSFGQLCIFLKDTNSEEGLAIWVSEDMGVSIVAATQNEKFSRPLTHELFCMVLKKLGVSVSSAIITDLIEDTFIATLVLNTPQGTIRLDCRPSDAIVMTLRMNAPLYAEEKAFELAASVITDQGFIVASPKRGPKLPSKALPPPTTAEEHERLKPFEEGLKDIDLNP